MQWHKMSRGLLGLGTVRNQETARAAIKKREEEIDKKKKKKSGSTGFSVRPDSFCRKASSRTMKAVS